MVTAVVRVALREPCIERPVAHRAAIGVLRQDRVAGDLRVVVHAEAREVTADGLPVAALAGLEQPVVAQPVLDVSAAPARVEGLDLAGTRAGQPQVQVPVVGPLREGMTLEQQPFAQARESRRVTPRPCVARGGDEAVAVSGSTDRYGR